MSVAEKGWNFTSWLFAILFLMVGAGAILSKAILSGLLVILIALIIMPVTKKFLFKKWKFDLSFKRKTILITIIFVIFVVSFTDFSQPSNKKALSECYKQTKVCADSPFMEDRLRDACWSLYYYTGKYERIINYTNGMC